MQGLWKVVWEMHEFLYKIFFNHSLPDSKCPWETKGGGKWLSEGNILEAYENLS